MTQPSAKEVQNAQKVLGFLADISDISFQTKREDIFEVTGLEELKCIVDVEETIVCIFSDICELPDDESLQFIVLKHLMELNHTAVHGKFTLEGNRIFFKENLEFENLDLNELEAALGWTFIMIKQATEKLSTIF